MSDNSFIPFSQFTSLCHNVTVASRKKQIEKRLLCYVLCNQTTVWFPAFFFFFAYIVFPFPPQNYAYDWIFVWSSYCFPLTGQKCWSIVFFSMKRSMLKSLIRFFATSSQPNLPYLTCHPRIFAPHFHVGDFHSYSYVDDLLNTNTLPPLLPFWAHYFQCTSNHFLESHAFCFCFPTSRLSFDP